MLQRPLILIISLVLSLPLTTLASPKLLIKALSPTTIELPPSNETIGVYSITNTSQHPLTLTPSASLRILKGPKFCKANTLLAPKDKCLLVFKITHQTQSDDVNICYQSPNQISKKCVKPEKASRLTLHPIDEPKALLTLTDEHYIEGARPLPKTVSLSCPIYLISGSSADRILRIRNNSTSVTATNIQITNLSLLPGVTQNAAGCASVAPGATCTLTVNASAASATATQSLTVAGSNTTSLSVPMYVNIPLVENDNWEGGIIFLINSDGSSGKVAYNTNSTYSWSPSDAPDPNVNTNAESLTNGLTNTNDIINTFTGSLSDYAAQICNDLVVNTSCESYTNWYLPAQEELSLEIMYVRNILGGLSNLNIPDNTIYWTSTQEIGGPLYDRAVAVNSGIIGFPSSLILTLRTLDRSVICTRAFSYATP